MFLKKPGKKKIKSGLSPRKKKKVGGGGGPHNEETEGKELDRSEIIMRLLIGKLEGKEAISQN